MKKPIFVIAITFLMISGGFAQHIEADRVPDAVTSEFFKMSPQAMNPMWMLEGDIYQVMFTQGEKGLVTRHALRVTNVTL